MHDGSAGSQVPSNPQQICKLPNCGQKFSQLGNLRTHERRHAGIKPFKCSTCEKRFTQRGNVRAHEMTHKGLKPYHCKLEGCGKDFSQLGNLKVGSKLKLTSNKVQFVRGC